MYRFSVILSSHLEVLAALQILAAMRGTLVCNNCMRTSSILRSTAKRYKTASTLTKKQVTLKRQQEAKLLCEGLLAVLAAIFKIPIFQLQSQTRGTSAVSRIRQFGMYIAHTMFSLTMAEVAFAFSRERTTVKYACHLIEDMREDKDFDRVVSAFEYQINTLFSMRGGQTYGE